MSLVGSMSCKKRSEGQASAVEEVRESQYSALIKRHDTEMAMLRSRLGGHGTKLEREETERRIRQLCLSTWVTLAAKAMVDEDGRLDGDVGAKRIWEAAEKDSILKSWLEKNWQGVVADLRLELENEEKLAHKRKRDYLVQRRRDLEVDLRTLDWMARTSRDRKKTLLEEIERQKDKGDGPVALEDLRKELIAVERREEEDQRTRDRLAERLMGVAKELGLPAQRPVQAGKAAEALIEGGSRGSEPVQRRGPASDEGNEGKD